MAWKLRKDRLQAKTPQEEENGVEPDVTSSAPTPEAIVLPGESDLSPSLEIAPFPPPPFLPVEDESAQVRPAAEANDLSAESAKPPTAPSGFGLKWRSRKSREEAAVLDDGHEILPAAEVLLPSPPPAPAFPYAFPETETPEPELAPLDLGEPFFLPDPLPEVQPADEMAEPVPLPEAEPEVVTAQVQEPHFAPFDFAPPVPEAEALLSAEEQTEKHTEELPESEEEPLFSPMPTPIWNAYLPPVVEARSEDGSEPFFPLPPQGDNPFLEPIADQPRNGDGEGAVEEPHFLAAEPQFIPLAEVPQFVSLPPMETAIPVESEIEVPEPERAPEPGPPELIDDLDPSRPAFLPSIFATPAEETVSIEPVAEIEPLAETEPLFDTEFSELSPFAPFQPPPTPDPELVQEEASTPPLELDEPEVSQPPFEAANLTPTPSYDATPAFVSLTDFAPLPTPVDQPPAFVSPFGTYSEQDAEREEIAPSLVMPETGTGVPRVAPFIVDIPSMVETPAASGTLVLRMGKLSANYPVTKDAVVIGRPDSGVQSYPDLEIELDDAVSRRHAEVRRHEDSYFVVDTMSTNGTFLNGEKLDPYKEYPLAPGDRIRIGDRTELIFE